MQRYHRLFLASMMIIIPVTANARAQPMVGVWCAPEGRGVVYIEDDSIGFNEHTICDLEIPLAGAKTIETELNCKNVYSYDGGTVEAFETTVAFSAELVSETLLSVMIDESAEPEIYEFCGE